MTNAINDERRKYSRVTFATEILIHLEAEGKIVKVQGNSRDLSLKGLFIGTDEVFSTGTKCEIRICLTGGIDKIELQINGRVVRVSKNGMGIVFDSMDVDSYSHLKNIVQYNSTDVSV
ncbi:MAG: PilZ domain-containing protein [Desulfobacula sp.]|nr:PilZ domain-containing protein [Desulfobacula sp.]